MSVVLRKKAPTYKSILVSNVVASVNELVDEKNKTIANVKEDVRGIVESLKTLYKFDLAIPPSTYIGDNQEQTQYLLDHKPILLPSSYEKMTTVFDLFRIVFVALPMFICVTIVLIVVYLYARYHPIVSEGWENFKENHFVKGSSVFLLLIVVMCLWYYLPWVESQMISLSI